MELSFTLLSDGSSDRALLPIIRWTMRQHLTPSHALNGAWADLRRLRDKPSGLHGRIETALTLYQCDLLFIHRDAESPRPESRYDEIREALAGASVRDGVSAISVVPVRMTEAWLLFDEQAIRTAAGNPNGRAPLSLPDWRRAEHLPDPKTILFDALRRAAELPSRRLRKFRVQHARSRIGDFVDDFAPLRELPGFQRFERDVQAVCIRRGLAA